MSSNILFWWAGDVAAVRYLDTIPVGAPTSPRKYGNAPSQSRSVLISRTTGGEIRRSCYLVGSACHSQLIPNISPGATKTIPRYLASNRSILHEGTQHAGFALRNCTLHRALLSYGDQFTTRLDGCPFVCIKMPQFFCKTVPGYVTCDIGEECEGRHETK